MAVQRVTGKAGVRVRKIYQAPTIRRLRAWTEAHITPNRIVAAIIWLAGWYATGELIRAFGVESLGTRLIAQTALQAVLTVLERPLWRPRVVEVIDDPNAPEGAEPQEVPQGSDHDIALGALLIDVLINAGGVWVIIKSLDKTPTWRMIVESLKLNGTMSGLVAMILSIVIGYVIAKAPERVWRWE